MNNKKRRIIGYIIAALFFLYGIYAGLDVTFHITPWYLERKQIGAFSAVPLTIGLILLIMDFVKAAKNGFRDEEEQQKADKKNKSRSASKKHKNSKRKKNK